MHLEAPDWAIACLRNGRVARLGTADAAGRPLVVPVCYGFDGHNCYSAIDAKPKRTRRLKRLRNIAENPQVTLLVDHYEEDWTALRYVMVHGHGVILHTGAEFSGAIDLLVAKYPQYQEMGLDRESGTVIKIVPDRVLHWRFDAGVVPELSR